MHLVKLNLARNCLRYIIRKYGIREIYIPYYTCETVWNSVRKENCKIKFYHVNENFVPIGEFPEDAFILYTNYFGLSLQNCINLAQKYKNLIVDNSHSFYSPHLGLASFNSLRKFFPVSSGAYLYIEDLLEEDFDEDTLELPKVMFHEDYDRFVKNEEFLNAQKQILKMSKSVEKDIIQVDFTKEKEKRRFIFKMYESVFSLDNALSLTMKDKNVPYCYPFSPIKSFYKEVLLKNDFYLLRLWKDFPLSFEESRWNNLVALPLNDERYARKIIKLISNNKL